MKDVFDYKIYTLMAVLIGTSFLQLDQDQAGTSSLFLLLSLFVC